MSDVLEVIIDDGNFQQEVLNSDLPVLVDFWAQWCGPCHMISPFVEEIAKEYQGKLKVCKLNVETGPQVSSSYGVMNIPTLMIFKNGEVVDKIVGVVPKGEIISKIDPHL